MMLSSVFIKSLDHCPDVDSDNACDDSMLLLLDTMLEVVGAIKGLSSLLNCRCCGIRRGSGGLLNLHLAITSSVGETGDTGFETGDPTHWNDVALSSFPKSLTPTGKVKALEAVAESGSKSAGCKDR